MSSQQAWGDPPPYYGQYPFEWQMPKLEDMTTTVMLNPIELTKVWRWVLVHKCTEPLTRMGEVCSRRVSIVSKPGSLINYISVECQSCGQKSDDLTDLDSI